MVEGGGGGGNNSFLFVSGLDKDKIHRHNYNDMEFTYHKNRREWTCLIEQFTIYNLSDIKCRI